MFCLQIFISSPLFISASVGKEYFCLKIREIGVLLHMAPETLFLTQFSRTVTAFFLFYQTTQQPAFDQLPSTHGPLTFPACLAGQKGRIVTLLVRQQSALVFELFATNFAEIRSLFRMSVLVTLK